MTSDAHRVAWTAPGVPEPVGPSPIVRGVMRPMAKLRNPLILRLAGRRHFRMAAQLRHVARLSGRVYTTPVSGRRSGDLVLIALTFGNQSDWARNVQAAGNCSMVIEGVDYDLTEPRFLTRQEARPLTVAAFSRMERASFRMLGIKQIMFLRIVPAQR